MAFSRCRKDFYRIQKKVQTKSVAQCVEYYYTWKKKLVFDRLRAKAKAQRRKAERDQPQHPKEKAVASPGKCRRVATESTGTPSSDASQPPSHAGSGDALQGFPCPECGRVFAKINGRNAHMKRHCPEEDLDYLRKVRWPLKRPKTEPKAEESRMLMAFESGDSPARKRQ
ncbi:zinc finger protein 541-like [Cuculus canorus]|uniref:zinc finger protein 541-like n=1 Tax=Cuculus canorus TaxID=55661 RepID=UPI0023AB0F9E|nr:zinc finger protein 541-like [Cuculus canorus]XP_053910760.1 zinc finger protein 541-like [Cuculus canorus]XP_053910761.1 zinc finger protein 541-like [Cuculus canorus]